MKTIYEKGKMRNISIVLFIALLLSLQVGQASEAQSTSIKNLKVNSTEIPLAIEDAHPLFSWEMSSSTIGKSQSAYQIIVTRETDNKVIWDSGKVESGASNNIEYMGVALQPEMEYTWDVTAWDETGNTYTETSRFETGIMNPDIHAWDGAEWIGSNELVLDAATKSLFYLNTDFRIVKGNTASLILGGK